MARIAFLIKQPKRALGALAVLVAATGVVVGSGANFSASTANPTNTFSAGTLSMSNSKNGAAILSASGLKPGDTPTTGTVDIQNTGSLAGNFSVSRTSLTNTDATNPLSGKLNLVIKDCGEWPDPSTVEPCGDGDDTTVYGSPAATVAAMTSAVSLGNYSANEKHRYEFSVQLDSSATDAYQNGQSTVEFTWNAVQS
ncbi:MAG TPA: TasA family protein [Solirubrobacteraceae bacterium]